MSELRFVIRADWGALERVGMERIFRETREAVLDAMVDDLRATAPGGLKNAIRRTSAGVVVDSPIAAYVEFGTRPHWPPPGALSPWVEARGKEPSAEFRIARAIAYRGTPAKPFFRPARQRALREVSRLFGDVWGKYFRGAIR